MRPNILQQPNLVVGEVPSRTCVQCMFFLKDGDDPNNPLDVRNVVRTIKSYHCLDCSYTTSSVAEMNEHQDNQSKHHSYWQRIKRFSHMLYCRWFRVPLK